MRANGPEEALIDLPMPRLDGLGLFNLGEAIVWLIFGIGLLVGSRRSPACGVGRIAGIAFLLFGTSGWRSVAPVRCDVRGA